MIVTPNFHFSGDCNEAIEFYKKVFDIKVLCLYKDKDANPDDYVADSNALEKVYHAEVLLGNTRLMMSDRPNEDNPSRDNPLSLVVTYDTAEEVKHAYELIRQGASILSPIQSTTYSSCFVSLIDKYGMRWELMTEQTEK